MPTADDYPKPDIRKPGMGEVPAPGPGVAEVAAVARAARQEPAAPNAIRDVIVKRLVEVRRELTRFPDSRRYVDARRHVEIALDLAVEALLEETD